MSTGYLYEPLPDAPDGVRLHLNENTDGCSPAVLRAIRRLTRQDVAWYPAYQEATQAVADFFGVTADEVLLTNGLDEGILTLALALLPRQAGPSSAVVVEPAYGLYGPAAALAGATVRPALPKADLSFDAGNVLGAIAPDTRLIMMSNPNNPAGHLVSTASIVELAASVGPGVILFVDEAYADFAGTTVVPALASTPNLVVGRTFAKAWGLAGMRIGCLLAAPAIIRQLRGAIAPFSVNVFAATALSAALGEHGHFAWYLNQVRASKDVLYAAFERLGLPFWRSHANFVLVRVGDAPLVRQELANRGIHVRDRSSAPGCEGCIRITAGLADDARACVAALEEVLCAAPR
jgi:histidinol-phosphate aminotransferase